MRIFLLMLVSMYLTGCGCSIVSPGERAIKVTMGAPDTTIQKEGLVMHVPLLTHLERVNVQQRTEGGKVECFSSDMQTVILDVAVMYRLPETKVYDYVVKYQGNIFETIISPNTSEAVKEHTSSYSAEDLTKKREEIKAKALETLRKKIGDVAVIEDLIIRNIDLSDELEKAIESKMVQQQEAAKAQFLKEKARTEAETALIRAQGEANAINVRGKAIKENPGLIDLTIAEKWDGKTPLVVGAGQGSNILLPIGK